MANSTTGDAPGSDGKSQRAGRAKLTSEEHRQLLTHHMAKLRRKGAEIDDLRAPLKEAQEDFTALVNEAKADLGKGYTRKYLMVLLEDTTTRLRNLIQEEQRRARDREALGLPVFGVQADLFDSEASAKLPDEVRDERFWEAQGFLLGRAGKLNEIPDGCPPRFHQTVMRAAAKGQELTQADVLAAMELKRRQSEPDAAAAAVDLNPEPEPGTREAKAAERKAIAKAKAGLDALGGGEPAGFEATPGELAAQKTRQAVVNAKEGLTSGEPANQVAA